MNHRKETETLPYQHDMYGNEIHPLGETGYGVSLAIAAHPSTAPSPQTPILTLFHASDGFRQSLLSIAFNEQTGRPTLSDIFTERCAELISSAPHGIFEGPRV